MFGCSSDEERTISPDLSRNYFGFDAVSAKEFLVEQTSYQNNTAVTSTYLLREEYESVSFVGGEEQRLIKRFSRSDSTSDWSFDSTWKMAVTENEAFRVENDVRFVKLSFPVEIGEVWDVNAYNVKREKQALYSVEIPVMNLANEIFTDVIQVELANFITVVNSDYEVEFYGKDVGLLNRKWRYLKHEPGKDTTGTSIEETLISYEVF